MVLPSGLWWVVAGCGGARHGGERGGKIGKLEWEGNRYGARGVGY